jgi:hypothetical protein
MPDRALPEIARVLYLLCAAAGVAVFVSAAFRRVLPGEALRLALDFWLAAGLLRLSWLGNWSAILTAAAIVAVRKGAMTAFAREAPAPPTNRGEAAAFRLAEALQSKGS